MYSLTQIILCVFSILAVTTANYIRPGEAVFLRDLGRRDASGTGGPTEAEQPDRRLQSQSAMMDQIRGHVASYKPSGSPVKDLANSVRNKVSGRMTDIRKGAQVGLQTGSLAAARTSAKLSRYDRHCARNGGRCMAHRRTQASAGSHNVSPKAALQ